MIKHSSYLEKHRERIVETGYLDSPLLDFYKALYLLQEEFQVSAEVDISVIPYEKLPVLNSENIVLSDSILVKLKSLLGKIVELVMSDNDGMDFTLLYEDFNESAESSLRALLAKDFDFLKERSSGYRLGLDECIFVLHNVFKPLLVMMREKTDFTATDQEWGMNNCPFCGYSPDISKIVDHKDNKRILHCAICENEWDFPRLSCIVCGNKEQSTQGFFEFEDDTVYRVYYCDECKNYVKTLRIPKKDEESGYDPAVEDILTNFMDATMLGKGYSRP